jgi:hypothetical protein
MRARFVLVVITIVVLGACTGQPAGRHAGQRARPWGETLLLQTEDGAVSVSAATGSTLLSGVDGVASADGTRVYATARSGGDTLLRTLDAASGDLADEVRVPGRFDVSIVAPSGTRAALIEPLPAGIDPWTPIPRAKTTIVVADPTGASEPRAYELGGNYEPEAFSTDGRTLFLIQRLPAEAPRVYRVTAMDLARGRVFQVFGPFKAPPERMPGTRLEQVASPDGRFLFTLYTTDRPDYAHLGIEDAGRDRVLSFVHVLSLEEGWAHCAGLPKAFWGRPAESQAMAVSPDGRSLFVVDAGLGEVVTMDTESLEVSAPRAVLEPSAGVRASAAVTPDGGSLLLASGATVSAFDAARLEPLGTWEAGAAVSGLAPSPSGERVFVVLDDRIAVWRPDAGLSEGSALPELGPVVSVSAIGR